MGFRIVKQKLTSDNLKVKGQISQKRYEIDKKCQWKLDRKLCMDFRIVSEI